MVVVEEVRVEEVEVVDEQNVVLNLHYRLKSIKLESFNLFFKVILTSIPRMIK